MFSLNEGYDLYIVCLIINSQSYFLYKETGLDLNKFSYIYELLNDISYDRMIKQLNLFNKIIE